MEKFASKSIHYITGVERSQYCTYLLRFLKQQMGVFFRKRNLLSYYVGWVFNDFKGFLEIHSNYIYGT